MKIKSLLAVALIFAAPAFAAEEPENYDREILGGYMGVNTDADLKYTGFNLEYRKHQNDYFAYGVAINYGYDSYSFNNGYASGTTDTEIAALDGSLMLKIPLDRFYIYGKAGLSLTSVSLDVKGFSNGYYVDTSVSDSALAPFFGVGVSARLKDRWLVDLSFTRKDPEFDLGYGVKGKAELDSVFVQVGYQF